MSENIKLPLICLGCLIIVSVIYSLLIGRRNLLSLLIFVYLSSLLVGHQYPRSFTWAHMYYIATT